MKTKLVAVMLLAGGSIFAQGRFSIGVNVGGVGAGYYQATPPSYAANVPPCPGPDYSWVDGRWSRDRGRNSSYNAEPRFEQRFDNRFNEGGRGITRGFDQNRNPSFGQDRSRTSGFSQGQDRNFNSNQNHAIGQNNSQNQNRGQASDHARATGQDNRQVSGFTNGSRYQ